MAIGGEKIAFVAPPETKKKKIGFEVKGKESAYGKKTKKQRAGSKRA